MVKRLEDQIQITTVKYLRLQYPQVLICAAVPEARGGNALNAARAGAKAKRMGYTAGWPDLCIHERKIESDDELPGWGYQYYGLAIEFKTEKGRQSKAQKEVQEKLEAQGWRYEICRSFDQAKEIIDEYLN